MGCHGKVIRIGFHAFINQESGMFMRIGSIAIIAALLLTCTAVRAQTPVIASAVDTAPLPSYDEAPGTPDSDDPAIWVDRAQPARSLIIGTLKDAGLIVFNLQGEVLQRIAPPNLPSITSTDPPTPAGLNEQTTPCPESASRTTFGRFNNVAVAYDVQLGTRRRDLAVVTDRGCDRLRIYAIEPSRAGVRLVDITSHHTPRIFPLRFVQPSPLQPGNLQAGLQANPLDDQSTAYGIGLWQPRGQLHAFVSQRSRSVVLQLRFTLDRQGRVTYVPVRPFVFDPVFTLRGAKATFDWTPCRESADDDPQSEGIVIDEQRAMLYVAFETIGVYRLSLDRLLPPVVRVGRESLLDVTTQFGRPYVAIANDDEFDCQYSPQGKPPADAIVAVGSDEFAGKRLAADVEGLAIYPTGKFAGQLLVSSQGDDTFHLYDRQGRNRYLGAFKIDATVESDGVEVTSTPLGGNFPQGLMVVQNGAAEDPADTSDINGFEYDGSTQFRIVDWRAVARAVLGRR
jgi:3-phytase